MATESEDRIKSASYLAAIRALGQDNFDVAVPETEGDPLQEIGNALRGLAATLRDKFEERRKLDELPQRISEGLLVEETLEHVFESFQPIIPYDRIGYAKVIDGGSVARAMWAATGAEADRTHWNP